ncbi:hypothetical protein [Streptomyces coffeae]|uniref:Secreted protein n=1 Tax=Streptomyces coffeae TaxID=621382 RepID=A0ABS1NJK9_9ACTN|nr:hypothetical protein [Streptomyces coffeae]MBL1100102.1 hypothetical protein [Streptomyces coffeae]
MSSTINGLAVAALVVTVAVLGWAVETRLRSLYALPAEPPAEFQPLPPGTVWRACHDVTCGHMTTRWLPRPDGSYRCEHAARHRGDVHLTHTTEEGRSA